MVVSDSDDARFASGTSFETDQGEILTVAGLRQGKHGRIILFEGVRDRDGAEALRGRTLTISRDQRRQLADSEYWPDQLVGLAVISTEGIPFGTVTDVIFGVAQDRLVIQTSERTVEVPFVHDLVPEVDVNGGRVVIAPIDGLVSGGG